MLVVISVGGRNQGCVWMIISVVGRAGLCVDAWSFSGQQESGLCVDSHFGGRQESGVCG